MKEGILLKLLKNPTSKNKGFSYLVDLYHEKIYWMIRKMVLSHDSANDVLQNTYIRIFKGIENFKEKSKLSTWIYRIAYNESIRFLTNESFCFLVIFIHFLPSFKSIPTSLRRSLYTSKRFFDLTACQLSLLWSRYG